MKTLTVVQAKHLADEAERLFAKAAAAWVRGNNSGDPKLLERGDGLSNFTERATP